MKKTKHIFLKRQVIKPIKLLFFSSLLFLFFSVLIFAYTTGITGRTKMSNYPGCPCHGANPSTEVVVMINGPDTVTVSSTTNYTVTVSGGPLSAAGTDIAASEGTLAPISSKLHLSNSELTHQSPQSPDSTGVVKFEFTYTAPKLSGEQIIYAVGNSVNYDGTQIGDEWNFASNKTIQIISPTGIEDQQNILSYKLEQNYPNPFNPITSITYSIPKNSNVNLKVFSLTGQEMATLVNEEKSPGTYEVNFDASQLPSEVYFYQIKAGDFIQTKKMILLK